MWPSVGDRAWAPGSAAKMRANVLGVVIYEVSGERLWRRLGLRSCALRHIQGDQAHILASETRRRDVGERRAGQFAGWIFRTTSTRGEWRRIFAISPPCRRRRRIADSGGTLAQRTLPLRNRANGRVKSVDLAERDKTARVLVVLLDPPTQDVIEPASDREVAVSECLGDRWLHLQVH
jgi:hypothetical protein